MCSINHGRRVTIFYFSGSCDLKSLETTDLDNKILYLKYLQNLCICFIQKLYGYVN